MRKFLLTILISTGLMSASTTPLTQLDSKASSVKFTFTQMGVASDGQFKNFNAAVQFDPADVDNSEIQFTIDLNSIDTGVPGGDDEVKGKLWLATKQFPQANFIAKKINALGGNKFSANGNLTMKGITQVVTIPFQLNTNLVVGQFSFKRLAFKIGEGEWADTSVVADDVVVKFNLTLK